MESIEEATESYERWLGARIELLEEDLELKHRSMRETAFQFFRATFYRWAQVWPTVCDALAGAPQVLAVGDLHIENFGTWRDHEARLIWGINDFDEAYPLAYANDLVRLGVSAKLAIDAATLELKPKAACEAILAGYIDSLTQGGRPFVLAEHHRELRQMAQGRERDPVRFWRRMAKLAPIEGRVPAEIKKVLIEALPKDVQRLGFYRRVSGLGSLGRRRIVAIGDHRGGKLAREAKAMAPSGCIWARGAKKETLRVREAMAKSIRSPDPHFHVHDAWIVRRLGPHTSRIGLASLPDVGDELLLLYSMGWETANVHHGSERALAAVLTHVRARRGRWLRSAVDDMEAAVLADWEAFRG